MKHYLPIEKAARPVTGKVIVDSWWICHPERGLLFVGRGWDPQCNSSKIVVEHLRAGLYEYHEVVFVPLVFLANVGVK